MNEAESWIRVNGTWVSLSEHPDHLLSEVEEAPSDYPVLRDQGCLKWRWNCSCGGKGSWTEQSDTAATNGQTVHSLKKSAEKIREEAS
jgi:hypothetical protein